MCPSTSDCLCAACYVQGKDGLGQLFPVVYFMPEGMLIDYLGSVGGGERPECDAEGQMWLGSDPQLATALSVTTQRFIPEGAPRWYSRGHRYDRSQEGEALAAKPFSKGFSPDTCLLGSNLPAKVLLFFFECREKLNLYHATVI